MRVRVELDIDPCGANRQTVINVVEALRGEELSGAGGVVVIIDNAEVLWAEAEDDGA